MIVHPVVVRIHIINKYRYNGKWVCVKMGMYNIMSIYRVSWFQFLKRIQQQHEQWLLINPKLWVMKILLKWVVAVVPPISFNERWVSESESKNNWMVSLYNKTTHREKKGKRGGKEINRQIHLWHERNEVYSLINIQNNKLGK